MRRPYRNLQSCAASSRFPVPLRLRSDKRCTAETCGPCSRRKLVICKRHVSPASSSWRLSSRFLPQHHRGAAVKATETDSLSSSEFVHNGPRQVSTTVGAKAAASCDDWSPYRIGGKAAGCPLLRFRLPINPPRLSPHRDAVRRLFAAAENEPPLQRNQMFVWQFRPLTHFRINLSRRVVLLLFAPRESSALLIEQETTLDGLTAAARAENKWDRKPYARFSRRESKHT
jgi:hypothetical protein